MDYQIVEKPAFTVAGKAVRVQTKNGENQQRIPQFWDECVRDGSVNKLAATAAGGRVVGNVLLGVCTDFADDMSEFTYMVAAEAPAEGAAGGMVEKAIPPSTWAVFEGQGALPDSMQEVWGRIWSGFFASSGYEHGNAPDLELYPEGDPHHPDYRFEVWVPVVKNAA